MPPLATALPVDHSSSCLANTGSWISTTSSNEVSSEPRGVTRSSATRKVRFSSSVEVYEVPNLNDFSKEEIDAVWLTVEECEQIRENCIQLLKRFKRYRTLSQDEKDCLRGLEGKRPMISKIRKRAKHTAKMVVFEFQKKQHYDVDKIASIYHEACQVARVQAIHSAQQDEKNVYHQRESHTKKKTMGAKKQSLFSMFRTCILVVSR